MSSIIKKTPQEQVKTIIVIRVGLLCYSIYKYLLLMFNKHVFNITKYIL